MKYTITPREWILILLVPLLGFIFSSENVLMSLDTLSPLVGIFVSYGILYFVLLAFSEFNLIHFGIKKKNPVQLFGFVLIAFSLFITLSWSSPLVNLVTHGTIDNISPVYFQTEDGAVWYFWTLVGITGIQSLRVLTFVVTPFIFTLLGSLLLREKVHF